jgi:hypothetical protein
VTDQPINLKVWSPNVLNLTLVDLPGLTKIAVEDQPPDIADQIERMVNLYISPDNAIILAITPATQDLANSDSLIAARRVDPLGNRTIGVLTKLDIMDKGTDARDVLLNKIYTLKLGYIGVVNRSQADINGKKSMAAAMAAEKKFFTDHPGYRDIAENCGTAFLTVTLNQILMRHIKAKLPALYSQINNLLAQKKRELESYGMGIRTDTLEDRELVLFELVCRYMEEFLAVLNGRGKLSRSQLDGGARVAAALIDEFPQKVLAVPSVKELPVERVANLIQNQDGLYRSMVFPEQSFSTLVKVEINKLRSCVVESIEQVQNLLVQIHNGVKVPELTRWKALRDQIVTIAQECTARSAREAIDYAGRFLDIQISFINTDHPDFKGVSTVEPGGQKADPVTQVVELTHRYYIIVRKEIMDAIPKAVYRLMLGKGIDQLRLELVEKLVIPGSLFEDSVVAERRRNCAALIEALKQASTVLTEVRKTHI